MKKIHPLADVQTEAVGEDTTVWQFCVLLPGCEIGANCNICAQVLIEGDVKIGNNVTVKSGVQLWNGVRVEDNVFIGPNVTFTNDRVPRSKMYPASFCATRLRKGCSVGANATLVAGIEVGEYALIGAGSVVTKNVPPHTVWYGNPAVQKGYVTCEGIILDMNRIDKNGNQHTL